MEESNPTLEIHASDTSETETNRIFEGPDSGSFFNDQGQQHLARLVNNYKDGQIHLSYHGSPCLLSPLGTYT